MKTSITAKQIEQQLEGDIAACRSLISLLNQEQEALKSRDVEALAAVIDNKVLPLTRLEESANTRTQWANITEPEKASTIWQELLESLNQQKLKDDWAELKTLTLECQKKNEINGKILVRNQQVYARLMDLLRGQSASPNLYSSKGASLGGHLSQRVGEA
jgi:flagella synthesis protein FlgN